MWRVTQAARFPVVRGMAVVVPAFTLLAATPFALLELLSGTGTSVTWEIVLPWALGLVAAPGVLWALVAWPRLRAVSRGRRALVRTSFVTGSVASLSGGYFSLFTVVGGVLGGWSFIVTLSAWFLLERETAT